MKIAVVTFHRAYSYGARLQAFALVRYLNDLGHQAEVLDYSDIGEAPLPKSEFRWALHKYILKKVLIAFANRKEVIRRQKFCVFSEKYTPCSSAHYITVDSLKGVDEKYDLFISGSDQVWNPIHNRNDLNFLLKFVKNDEKKISYAASFGTSELKKDDFHAYKKELATFGDILVRENEGADLVYKMLGHHPQVVLDPTFLIEKKIWEDIAVFPLKKSFKYILCFNIFKGNSTYNRLIKYLQKETGCKLVVLDHPYQFRYIRGKLFCTGGPREFLGLIKNASIVVTNSFHGTVFSILFKRPFYTVLNEFGFNSRLENLTNILGLSNRLISNKSKFPQLCDIAIDYECINRKLDEEIQKSKNVFDSILQKHDIGAK